MDPTRSFQEQMPGNHCWGCGPDNPDGLHLRSRWQGDEAVAVWQPRPEHMAGPRHILFGGIIAALIDCHSICTAYAAAFPQFAGSLRDDGIVLLRVTLAWARYGDFRDGRSVMTEVDVTGWGPVGD